MSTETSKEIKNKNIVEYLWDEIWNKRNFSVIGEVYSTDIHYHGASMELNGINELKQLTTAFSSAFQDTKVTLDLLFAKDDLVAQKFHFEGIHDGTFEEIPPTGKRINLSGITIQRLEKGKITEEWEMFDEIGLMKQLGMELRPMELAH